jgi:N-acetylmuramoyl-L-alanine amidase
MRPYVIRGGDYVSRLAAQHGFVAEEVWNHPANQELRRRRPNPEILAPGDVLRIPEPFSGAATVRPHATNRFRASVPRVDVRVRLQRGSQPLATERYAIEGAPPGVERQGTTDAEGYARLRLPITTSEVTLRIERLGIEIPVRVGHLDPSDERSGMRQRLTQLGYYANPDAATDEADRQSLRLFQRDHRLPETGEYDPATREALARANLS